MNWRSPRFFIPVTLIIFLLIGVSVISMYLHSSSGPTITWAASSTSFTQKEQQDIQTALKSALLTSNSNGVVGDEFIITDAQRQGDWADFSINEQRNHNTPAIPTEPLFFLAYVQNATWIIWTPGSPGFCDKLKQTPDTLLDAIDKQYFRGCYQ